ncbi:hypothetical protein LZ32DRAFT_611820 [Colletotrichum eremochloae]|nr:hypothetical protein LZ32DRAFT_611820 [Colletotrichum eremochloae]
MPPFCTSPSDLTTCKVHCAIPPHLTPCSLNKRARPSAISHTPAPHSQKAPPDPCHQWPFHPSAVPGPEWKGDVDVPTLASVRGRKKEVVKAGRHPGMKWKLLRQRE